MSERIKRKGDENLYQPKLQSLRVRQLHQIAVDEQKPMTWILDTCVAEGYKRYNENMKENLMERLAGSVSYFSLQKNSDGWHLSFVTNDTGKSLEFENENLKDVLSEASKVVFSSEDQTGESESSAPPIPRNQ